MAEESLRLMFSQGVKKLDQFSLGRFNRVADRTFSEQAVAVLEAYWAEVQLVTKAHARSVLAVGASD